MDEHKMANAEKYRGSFIRPFFRSRLAYHDALNEAGFAEEPIPKLDE